MLRLQMESQPLKYELSIQPAQMQLRTRRAELQIKPEPATVEISSPRGELHIDQAPCRYSLGIKNYTDFSRDFAREGKQAVLEGISRIAQEGTRLASIEKGGNPIAEIAKEATRPQPRTVTMVPIQPPIISYKAKPVEYNPSRGQLRFSVIPGAVSNDFQPGKVDIQILQYPSVRMWTTGSMDVKA